ncbi:MFS general substrate transporter [Trichocladium antarcticum]|uniref:MFS general substrate transporter n=1 Tax=Trichocladium antarcticum TaxID=1450529 RepID=A0AAN6UHV6_9PEZI|nr:MFS general substrate transporter [Trichocladium antarcticum]
MQDGVESSVRATADPFGDESEATPGRSRSRSDAKSAIIAETRTTSSDGPLLGKASPTTVSTSVAYIGDLDESYPEGGLRAWLVVFGCWLALFASLGFMNVLTTFLTHITTNVSIRNVPGAISGIISAHTLLSLLLGLYIGPLFDKYGPRWLILAGTVCLVTSLVIASIGISFWPILAALTVLSSLGTSLLFTPSIAIIAHYFSSRRGLATGIASTAGPAAGIVFPALLQTLFPRLGWPWAVRALALIFLAVTVAASFLIRARVPPPLTTTTTTTTTSHLTTNPHPSARIFLTRGFTPAVLAIFLGQFAAFLPLTYISAYALNMGFTHALTVDVIAAMNASSVAGRVAAGWAADRVGPFNASVLAAAVAALACFGVWFPAGATKPGVVVFAVVFGFVSGGGVSLAPVAVGRLCGTGVFGRYYGTAYAVVSVAVLLAIPVAGGLGADGKGYEGLIAMAGVFYIASAVAFAVAKVSVVGPRFWAAF